MLFVNERPVLLSGGCTFRGSDRVRVEAMPPLIITATEAADPTVGVVGHGRGFAITIAGFTPGTSMTSEAKATLGDGRRITLLTLANRIAELSDGPVYRVDYLVVERAD